MLSTVVLAFVLIGSASVVSFATDDDDTDLGRLNLNSDVLSNDFVGAGSAGEFAIRGKLFREELTTRVGYLESVSVKRLAVTGSLDFESVEVTGTEYGVLREALFDGYFVQVLRRPVETREESPVLYGLLVATGLPLVIIGGVQAGRFWSRRRRSVL